MCNAHIWILLWALIMKLSIFMSIFLFIYLYNKYLLSSYYVPGTILSDGDKQLTKQSPLHLHAHILVGLLLMSSPKHSKLFLIVSPWLAIDQHMNTNVNALLLLGLNIVCICFLINWLFNYCWKKSVHLNVHCSTIKSSQYMEAN